MASDGSPQSLVDEHRGEFGRRLRWVGAILAIGGVVIGMALAWGCAEKQRYEVLSFFFDGVPPPEGVVDSGGKPKVDPWTVPLEASDPRARAWLAQAHAEAKEAPKAYYFHTPFAKRDCFGCHTRERSMTAPRMTADLCKSCHGDYFETAKTDWVHGPAALGQCAMCHEAHKSEYKGLLTEAQPDICLTCHDDSRLLNEPYHETASGRVCSTCHDPHMAGNRLLLVDSQTYKRRRAGEVVSVHPRSEVGCATCHPAEQSNEVISNVDRVCVTCHDEPARTLSRNHTHGQSDPIGCTACHTPHRSSRPHLLRLTAEKGCLTCHRLERINSGNHPKVWRADCLICHKGHESDRPYLLRPGIPEAVRREADNGATEVAAPRVRGRVGS